MLREKFPKEKFELDDPEVWRKKAYESFWKLPIPSPKEEAWRYTDLNRFDFSNIRKRKKLSVETKMENVEMTDGLISLCDPKDKIDAYTQSFGEPCVFEVEKNSKARIEISVEPNGSGAALNEFHVGKNATLDVFVHYKGGKRDLYGEKSVFHVNKGGKVRYFAVQRFNEDVLSFALREFHLQADSVCEAVHADSGALLSRTCVRHHFEGDGAEVLKNQAVFFGKSQHFDMTTEALHHAKNTKSSILVKGALGTGGSSVYRGVIRIDAGARNTNSNLQDRVIHLGQNAVSHSIPSLFIDNNDVLASHSASVSKVSPDALFYLKSRGLSLKKAENLIVDGFLQEVLTSLPEERTVRGLRKDWEKKTGDGDGR